MRRHDMLASSPLRQTADSCRLGLRHASAVKDTMYVSVDSFLTAQTSTDSWRGKLSSKCPSLSHENMIVVIYYV